MEYVTRPAASALDTVDYSLLGGEHLERGRQLFTISLVVLASSLAYLAYNADTDNPLHVFQGMLIFALAALPSLLWARSGGSRFPAFETITIMCANAYALPLFNAREQLADYGDGAITRAAWAVLGYLLAANLAYRATGGQPGRNRFWVESIITRQIEKLIVYGLLLSTAYIAINTFTDWIPPDLVSILRAIFFGLSILCTFISAQRLGRGQLTAQEKTIFIGSLVIQLFLMAITLILIGSISLMGIALLGYLSGGKRIPWVILALAFTIFAVLHTGKERMRIKYWENEAPPPTFTELPAFYTEWIEFGLQPTSGEKTMSQKMLERTSLMHILCLIADYSPQRQDYLYGSTYRHVLPQLIPRFFWPEKPRSHIATYELAIYYGLQRAEDTERTTIAFGMLAEAYANFGLLGGLMLGVFWGFVLKKLQILSAYSPMFSFAGLFMILLTAWTFSSELTLAAWVSSFQQAVIVVLGIPLLLRSLLGL